MTKKKKIIIGVCVAVALIAVVIAAFFIIRAMFFGGPNIEHPFDGDGSVHTVVFDSNGGGEIPSETVRDGNTVRRPKTPEKDGYFLVGWFEDSELTDEWDFSRDRVKSDFTLYAGWSENKTQPTVSLVYEREGNAYTVTGVGEETVVVIPSEHEGLPVTKIGKSAFARKAFTEITLPDGMTEIERNAFYNCSALLSVRIGENSLLQEIGRNAFSGCGELGAFYLPAGVTAIGDSAFNNCGSIHFTVAASNSVYSGENGHLIEKETNTLIRGGQSGIVPEGIRTIAQAAFRKAKNVTELSVPLSVQSIGNYILSDSGIVSIEYAGTPDAWNAVAKSKMWNLGNLDVLVVCQNQE